MFVDEINVKLIAGNGGDGCTSFHREKKMPNLSKKGFFISLRGSVGGYKLAHEPHEYKIGDILRAAEGDMSPVSCVSDGFTCPVKKKCKTFYLWRDLNNVINDFLDSKTLDEYMED